VLGTVWIPAAQSKRRSSAGACVDGNWTQLSPRSCGRPCTRQRARGQSQGQVAVYQYCRSRVHEVVAHRPQSNVGDFTSFRVGRRRG
jgi:hypothetical protein